MQPSSHSPLPARRQAPPTTPQARYELRVFGVLLDRPRVRLHQLGSPTEVATQRKLYLLGPRGDLNVKVRDGRLEVKRRIEKRHGLERWAVEAREPLPLDPDWAREHLPALLGTAALPCLGEEPLRLRELLLRAVAPLPRVETVVVCETRARFRLGDVRAEHTRARVGGRALESLAVEGEDPEAVRHVALQLGLDPRRNTGWVEFLRALCTGPEGLGAEIEAR